MGVQGLWELLAPVGRRVSVESLGSRRLAIDASIWIIQFMKAMRDDRGDMIRNAHLLGFFRRICKLLFLRIKPVFVFDGGTPALKRRTVIARRRQREQAQSKIRKTAEKLLLNHLRTRKLEEIAGGVGAPLVPPKATSSKGKKAQRDNGTVRDDFPSDDCRLDPQPSPPVDTAVSYGGMHNQESADALLAASLPGQLDENTEGQTHVAQGLDQEQGVKQLDEEEDDDEEEELVYLPAAQGKLDPAVLASLPPSMQLDLLVQMREQLVAENRQKFEKVAKAPATFSQLQIEAYLKTVAFRREINNVQKAAAGRGVGGVPSTRIASATDREFIFSSSYQGDKMALTGANGGNPMSTAIKPPQPVAQPPEVPASSFLSAHYRDGTKSLGSEEADKKDSSVQTYVDEKGRTRVSRVRGMGVRMTRDLQWNLYLMKDVEKQQAFAEVNEDDEIATAEKLVSNGDGEAFQRLMLGDKANSYTSLSVDSLKQRGESDQMMNSSSLNSNTLRGLEITIDKSALGEADTDDGELFNRLVGGDVRSSCKDSSVDGHAERVSGDVRLNKSILQISLDIKDDDQDEDMDLFKTLVGGEKNSRESLQGPQRFPACTVVPEGIVNKEEDEDDCEWEDGDTQGRQSAGTMSEQQMIAVKSSEEISVACHNEHAKMSVGVQENLHKLEVDRKVPRSGEYKIPIPDDDDDVMDAAAQMTLAIEKSLEANISEPQPHPGSQIEGYSSARLSDKVSTPAFEASLVENVQSNKNEMRQFYNSAKVPNNSSLAKSNEEQMALSTQHSLQVYGNNVRVTESQPYIHTPTPKNFSLAGDSDAEMALAIQQSLAEHDRTRALQPGAYPESEDTGLSDDSDTGNSDESEVEWEDGSGAVAVAGSGFAAADPGLFLTEEDAELQEAIRRSLDDVGSWRAPVRPLPQLVIREPMEDVRERSGSLEIPGVGPIRGEEHQPLSGVEKIMDVDSEEARLARERARKGKAVAGETVISPVPVRKAVLQGGLEPEGPYQEYLKGKGICENDATPGGREIGNEHLGPVQMGTTLVSSLLSEGLVPPRQEQAEEGKENCPPSSVGVAITHRFGVEDAGPLNRDIRRSSQEISNSDARIHGSLTHSTRDFEEAGTIAERPAAPSEVWRQEQVDRAVHTSVERSTTHSNVPLKEANPMLLSGMAPRIEDTDSTSKKTGVLETQNDFDGSRDVQLRGHNPDKNVQGLNVVPEHVASNPQDLLAAEDILKDAEEMDLAKERSEMLNYEAKLLVEREALAREEAELQAVLQEEQEELRAGIEKERELLFQEEIELREVQKKNERNADSVTGEMFAECQELLQMFGLPYIIAPMEAEAQCAYMNTAELVDGVVTDDCDVFLFGGRNVYKNIFDDRKYVETYYMKDVETEMGMSREKLIRMALLLGSDYTEGISGIGIVNAIEVVNAFDEADGLSIFKEMVESPDYSLPGLQGLGYEMKGRRGKQTKKGKSGMEKMVENDNDDGGTDIGPENDVGDADIKLRQQVFMEKHRAVSKNWMIPDSFPSDAVVAAYANPQVDNSTDPFTWGRPDLEALRKFCYERFAWPKAKADDLLLPVLKEYDRRETQLRIDAFYSFNQRFAKVRSARIQKALRGTTGRQLSNELLDVPSQEGRPPAKKPKKKSNKEATSAGTKSSELLVKDRGDPKVVKGRGRGTSRGRGGRQTGQRGNVGTVSVDGQSVEEGKLDESQGLEADGLSQGYGRGKLKRNGSGRGRGRGRGRSSSGTIQDKDESSSSGSASEGAAPEVLERAGASKRKADNQLLSLRRSSRARTQADYNEPEGSDDGEHDGSSDGGSGSGRSQDDTLERNGSKKSSQVPLDPVIAETRTHQRTPLLIAKTEVLDSIPDVRVGVQPSSTGIYTSGGGFGVCNSDEELDATGRSFESPSIFHDSTSVRGDEVDAAAEMQQRLEPPEYLFTGGGFCVSDEEDVSPSLEHSQEQDNDNGERRGVGAFEESNLNVESNGHVDSVQHVGDPLVTPAHSLDETNLRVEMETQSTSAEPVQVPDPVGDIIMAEQNVARVDTGLRVMPMLRRKRPPKVP